MWFRLGGVVLVFGMVATVLAMTPVVRDAIGTPWFWVMGMTTGPGLLFLLFGVRAQARVRSAATASLRDAK